MWWALLTQLDGIQVLASERVYAACTVWILSLEKAYAQLTHLYSSAHLCQ